MAEQLQEIEIILKDIRNLRARNINELTNVRLEIRESIKDTEAFIFEQADDISKNYFSKEIFIIIHEYLCSKHFEEQKVYLLVNHEVAMDNPDYKANYKSLQYQKLACLNEEQLIQEQKKYSSRALIIRQPIVEVLFLFL